MVRNGIHEATRIPLTWVLVGYVPITMFVVKICLWMSTMDIRMGRMENKLSLPPIATSQFFPFQTTEAKE